jgi:hypothetical protein
MVLHALPHLILRCCFDALLASSLQALTSLLNPVRAPACCGYQGPWAWWHLHAML